LVPAGDCHILEFLRGSIMPIADQINRDMTEAMKAKQMDRLNALRMMKTALKLRETELPGSMDDSEAMRVLQKLLNQRHDAAEPPGARTVPRRKSRRRG
jgi:hypothetical protein